MDARLSTYCILTHDYLQHNTRIWNEVTLEDIKTSKCQILIWPSIIIYKIKFHHSIN